MYIVAFFFFFLLFIIIIIIIIWGWRFVNAIIYTPQKKEEDKFQVKYLRYNILKFSIKSKHLFVLINKIQTILSLSLISKNN